MASAKAGEQPDWLSKPGTGYKWKWGRGQELILGDPIRDGERLWGGQIITCHRIFRLHKRNIVLAKIFGEKATWEVNTNVEARGGNAIVIIEDKTGKVVHKGFNAR